MLALLLQLDVVARDLGHDDIARRERATEFFRAAGAPALPELLRCMESSDPEVRTRATRLVEDIGEAALPALAEARGDAFRIAEADIAARTARDWVDPKRYRDAVWGAPIRPPDDAAVVLRVTHTRDKFETRKTIRFHRRGDRIVVDRAEEETGGDPWRDRAEMSPGAYRILLIQLGALAGLKSTPTMYVTPTSYLTPFLYHAQVSVGRAIHESYNSGLSDVSSVRCEAMAALIFHTIDGLEFTPDDPTDW